MFFLDLGALGCAAILSPLLRRDGEPQCDLSCHVKKCFSRSVKTAVPEDGNPPGALVSMKLVEFSLFELRGRHIPERLIPVLWQLEFITEL